MLNHRSPRDPMCVERHRRRALEAEIATFASAADRADLEALLARYDDSVTTELHDILAHQGARAGRVTSRPWRPVGGI
jgi:hypothetical protein